MRETDIAKANGEIDDLISFLQFFRENELIRRWGDRILSKN